MERLNVVRNQLPDGVMPTLGPDATGVGQVFWYTLESDKYNLRELRTMQDWFVRYQLNAVSGVAEVASVGGYVQQYQIDVDPNKLRSFGMRFQKLSKRCRNRIIMSAEMSSSNRDNGQSCAGSV